MTGSPRILLAGVAALAALTGTTLTACGSDEAASTTTVADSPTTQPAADDDAAGDDAADDSDTGTSDDVVDVCTELTPEEVGAVVGGTVTVESDPGGGCTFNQEDPRATSVSFATTDVGNDDTDGTFNESRVGAFGTLSDPTTENPPIGDYAAVASGTIGGDNQQGVGLAQEGSTLIQVTLLQGTGLDGAAVRTMTAAALTLAVAKL